MGTVPTDFHLRRWRGLELKIAGAKRSKKGNVKNKRKAVQGENDKRTTEIDSEGKTAGDVLGVESIPRVRRKSVARNSGRRASASSRGALIASNGSSDSSSRGGAESESHGEVASASHGGAASESGRGAARASRGSRAGAPHNSGYVGRKASDIEIDTPIDEAGEETPVRRGLRIQGLGLMDSA